MIPAFTYGLIPTGQPIPPRPAATCAVRLIDRRTGVAHRINGTPLVVYTREPQAAATDLLAGRDPSVWEVRVDPLEREGTP
jgi:hypothetical protein